MDDQLLLPATIFDQRFEILALAGSGGMGTVYRARHIQMERIVAIKVLRQDPQGDSSALKRFQQEAQLASGLKHPNIAAVQSFGVYEGQPYIVFDFLEGENLQTILNREGKLPFERFTKIFLQACEGIAYAHSNGIIHRDLKPANIFLVHFPTADEQVKILDFGIAKDLGIRSNGEQKLTATGTLLGTPTYMSPEQARGSDISAHSDIYSLGCVMYQCCYGDPPFKGENAYQILLEHGYGSVPLDKIPDGYPNSIVDILGKCLAKQPQQRYGSADQLHSALTALGQCSAMPVVNPASTAKPVWQALPLKPAPFVVLVVAVAALIACFITGANILAPPRAKGITDDWKHKKDTHALRQNLARLASDDPMAAASVIADLRDGLMVSPSIDSAGIFIDIVPQLPDQNSNIRPFERSALVILHLLDQRKWQDSDQPAQLTRSLTVFMSKRKSHDEQAADLANLAMTFFEEDNLPAYRAILKQAFLLLRQSARIGKRTVSTWMSQAQTVILVDQPDALKLVSAAWSGMRGERNLPMSVRTAKLYDSINAPASALAWWQEALMLSDRSPYANKALRFSYLLAVADDEAALGQNKQSLQDYDKLSFELATLPKQEELAMILRLGYGYAVIHAEDKAGKMFTLGLAASDLAAQNAQSGRGNLDAGLSLAYKGIFLLRLGKCELAKAALAAAITGFKAHPYAEQIEINQLTTSADEWASDQLELEKLVGDLSRSQKPAAQKLESDALYQTTISNWYEARGDKRSAAVHLDLASVCYKGIPGCSPVASLTRAATLYYECGDYKDACPLLKQVLAKLPKGTTRLKTEEMLGHSLFKTDDYKQSFKLFDRLLWVLGPNDAGRFQALLDHGRISEFFRHGYDAEVDLRWAHTYAMDNHLTLTGKFRQAELHRIAALIAIDRKDHAIDVIHEYMEFMGGKNRLY